MAGRAMTSGEQTLARGVFKSQIDTTKVKIFNEKWAFFQPKDRAMAPNGNIYYAPGNTGYAADISTLGIHEKATFIHELTHVWQHQNGINVKFRGVFERNYDYLPIDAKSQFLKLGIEEQGNVVRDYYYLTQGFSNAKWPPLAVYIAVIPWLP